MSNLDCYTKPQWSRSVLLTIDVQEDFTRKDAPAYITGTEKTLSSIQRLLQYYRSNDRPIFHIIRLYHPDGANVDLCRKQQIEEGKEIVAPGSSGAGLATELKPDQSIELDEDKLLKGDLQQIGPREWMLYKPRWGAFYETCLTEMLNGLDISTVVVTGCNFPNCPRTTIYEASERDFRTVLVRDAVSGLYEKAEQELANIGTALVETEEIISF
jgi:nicotinamidase-related amidase